MDKTLGALRTWPVDAVRRHRDQWAATADTCARLHPGCDCSRIYRHLSAAAAHILETRHAD
jgi:hypothetical protein